jgi:hypothetical protein
MSASGHGSSATIRSSLPTPVSQFQQGGIRLEGGSGARRAMKESGLYDLFRNRPLPTPMASDGMKDGAGGGAGSTYPLRMILATPRKSDADRGGRGDVLSQLQGHASRHAGMMPTPVKPNGGRRLSAQEIETGKRMNGAKAPDRYAEPAAPCGGNPADADEAGQPDGRLEPGLRPQEIPDHGRGHGRGDDGSRAGQMGGSQGIGGDAAEPWADWNSGLARHLRMDDGISAWVAGTRIALGGPKGTSAASLIVEAFGDAVVPQIPEAIGRAILRTEAALDSVLGRDSTGIFPHEDGAFDAAPVEHDDDHGGAP